MIGTSCCVRISIWRRPARCTCSSVVAAQAWGSRTLGLGMPSPSHRATSRYCRHAGIRPRTTGQDCNISSGPSVPMLGEIPAFPLSFTWKKSCLTFFHLQTSGVSECCALATASCGPKGFLSTACSLGFAGFLTFFPLAETAL